MANLIYMRILEGFPEMLYSRVSHATGYAKRGLVTTKPELNDVVLLDYYDDMPQGEPTELAYLNRIGLGPKPENVKIVDLQHARPWIENVKANHDTIEWLRAQNLACIKAYTGKSTMCHALAKELDIPIESPSAETCNWAESKQTLQLLNDKFHHSPRGYICRDNEEILHYWHKLNKLKDFEGLAVVKASQSASGVVSSVISNTNELVSFLNKFNYSELDGGIIEEWVANDPNSPSINYDVNVHGQVKEAFICDQVFEDDAMVYGEEGTRVYRGNLFPTRFSKAIQEEIRTKTRLYLNELNHFGYWGPVGFDTIVLDKPHNGHKVFVSEINPRITGPRFGHIPMKFLGASTFLIQNQGCNPRLSAEQVEKKLQPILFNAERKEGYIFFNFFPGKYTGILLATNAKRLRQLTTEVNEYLAKLSSSEELHIS